MSQPEVVAHWHLLVDDFTTDVSEFYSSVEAHVLERGIPDTSTERFTCREGGIFSAKRVYLRIRREKQLYELCAAPYGNHSFFFSSWGLVERPGFLARVPMIGPLLLRVFKPTTFYAYDTTLMFQESVGRAVREAIDSTRTKKGLRSLAPELLQPSYQKSSVGAPAWT